jgi:hypothetical protein
MRVIIILFSLILGNSIFAQVDSFKISRYDLILLASFSPESKATILDKFPDLFQTKETLDLRSLRTFGSRTLGFAGGPLGNTWLIMDVQNGQYLSKGFRLNSYYKWELITEGNEVYLLPYKR